MVCGMTAARWMARRCASPVWVALPPAEENSSPESQYIPAEAIEHVGPVRVMLGQHGSARSPIRAPQGINYFHVRLKNGQHWRYVPPTGRNVAWLAVDRGSLQASEEIGGGQLAAFAEGEDAIEVRAQGEHVVRLRQRHQTSRISWCWVTTRSTQRAGTRAGRSGNRAHRSQLRAQGRLWITTSLKPSPWSLV